MKDYKGIVSMIWGNNAIAIGDGDKRMSFSQYGGLDFPVDKGDEVEFKYNEKAKEGKIYNNIVAGSLKLIRKAPKDVTSQFETKQSNDRDVLIVRQSCLKSAVKLYKDIVHEGISPAGTKELVLGWAEEFEKWVFR